MAITGDFEMAIDKGLTPTFLDGYPLFTSSFAVTLRPTVATQLRRKGRWAR
jgi:hypothetical protein